MPHPFLLLSRFHSSKFAVANWDDLENPIGSRWVVSTWQSLATRAGVAMNWSQGDSWGRWSQAVPPFFRLHPFSKRVYGDKLGPCGDANGLRYVDSSRQLLVRRVGATINWSQGRLGR